MKTSEGGLTPLEEEVAVSLLGFRWVRWDRERPDGGPSDEEGRFLASEDGLLSRFQVPANLELPQARAPGRYLPPFLEEVGAAAAVAQRTGLFGGSGAVVSLGSSGEWEVRKEGGPVAVKGGNLAEVLCRAALAWSARHQGG